MFEPTTFVPNTSPDKAIDIANGYLNEYYHWDAERLELEPRYTVGLFTGAYEITQEPVEKRKVAVVVYKGLPSQYLGYCTGEFNTEGTTYTLVLDDATGEFIAGSVTSRSPC